MATASTFTEATNPTDGSAARLLVSLTPLSADALEPTLRNIAAAFSGREVQVATPDPLPPDIEASLGLRAFTYTPAAPSAGGWLLTAADFLNTYKEMEQHGATACLLLGPEAQTLSSEGLAALASGVLSEGVDLTVPHYDLGPRDGLVNAAILYPTTRAIFGTKPRYPLAVDLALSARMAERLATASQRLTAAGLNNGLLWPVSEAASAGYTIAEAHVGRRGLPAPDSIDLNAVLAQVTGSLFADIEAKASFWQRARVAYSPKAAAARTQTPALETGQERGESPDTQPMVESFHLAYSNLQEIWSLVLPPNSLLGLKRLSLLPAAEFRMPDELWARIVYDFALAYRLRTINRGHLMGALTPLYLAWVASHLRMTAEERWSPEAHIESLAAKFETDKPYLVARWRWPDRFNP